MSSFLSDPSKEYVYYKNKIHYTFNRKIVNNKQIIYCKSSIKKQILGQIRIVLSDNHQLELHIKELNKKINDKNILLSRMIDRAIRAVNYTGSICVTILNNHQENMTKLCHYGIFWSIGHKVHIGFSSKGGIEMSANKRGVLAIEALKSKFSWKIGGVIKKNYDNCLSFIKFLEVSYQPLQLKKIPTDIAPNLDNKSTYGRPAVSAYLAHNNKRLDNRNLDEIRPLYIDINESNNIRVDFQRGNTYISSIGLLQHSLGRYTNRYLFPHGRKRRDIGHTQLIYKTINNIVPQGINITNISEVLESDGSSSMASVCAESLILASLGLINKSQIISGLSFGLFRYKEKKIFITDMTAKEDHYSEIDCKITGNKKGIVSIQMDTKSYITIDELLSLFDYAKIQLLKLLKIMKKKIKKSYDKICTTSQKIGLIIGKQGKNIQFLKKFTKAKKLIVYGNWIIFSKKNKLLEQFLNLIINPKKDQEVIFEIKNLNPLATIIGKITNVGPLKNFKKNEIVRGVIRKWDNKIREIEILESLGVRV